MILSQFQPPPILTTYFPENSAEVKNVWSFISTPLVFMAYD
jgi:hypothetical protein